MDFEEDTTKGMGTSGGEPKEEATVEGVGGTELPYDHGEDDEEIVDDDDGGGGTQVA